MTGYDKAAPGNPDDDMRIALFTAACCTATEEGGNLYVIRERRAHLDEEVGQKGENEEEDVLSHDGLHDDAGLRQRVLVLVRELLKLLFGEEECSCPPPSLRPAFECSSLPPSRSETLVPQ